MRKTVLKIAALSACAWLCACGIKPSALSAPDPDKDYFPRVYPDPANDPSPKQLERQLPK
jgi:hypothetical protein